MAESVFPELTMKHRLVSQHCGHHLRLSIVLGRGHTGRWFSMGLYRYGLLRNLLQNIFKTSSAQLQGRCQQRNGQEQARN